MIYIYAHTNNKSLDSLRRAEAIYERFKADDDMGLLLNDHRAQAYSRNLNLPSALTIDSILDLNVVTNRGDSVIIDSNEEYGNKYQFFQDYFDKIYRVTNSVDNLLEGEEPILYLDEILVSSRYKDAKNTIKSKKIIFIDDSDKDMILLPYAKEFNDSGFELIVGDYIFPSYEDKLNNLFDTVYESEEYIDLIPKASVVITASVQTALEANTAGSKVFFVNTNSNFDYISDKLTDMGIDVIEWNRDTIESITSQSF